MKKEMMMGLAAVTAFLGVSEIGHAQVACNPLFKQVEWYACEQTKRTIQVGLNEEEKIECPLQKIKLDDCHINITEEPAFKGKNLVNLFVVGFIRGTSNQFSEIDRKFRYDFDKQRKNGGGPTLDSAIHTNVYSDEWSLSAEEQVGKSSSQVFDQWRKEDKFKLYSFRCFVDTSEDRWQRTEEVLVFNNKENNAFIHITCDMAAVGKAYGKTVETNKINVKSPSGGGEKKGGLKLKKLFGK